MIPVLIGPPGVGKTYIGQLIQEKLGQFFFDADLLIDKNERKLIQQGKYEQKDRDKFVSKVIKKTSELIGKYKDNIVIAEAFTKEKNREEYKKMFPTIKFILVKSPKILSLKRVMKRILSKDHVIDKMSFEVMWDGFESPEVPHSVINNHKATDKKIIESYLKARK